jgi:hypothetical protein
VIVPPPAPAITLSPELEDVDPETYEVIARCVSALTGQVAGVIVTGIGCTDHHVVVEVSTALGGILLMELMDDRPLALPDSPPGR